jgi:hypothetical protein
LARRQTHFPLSSLGRLRRGSRASATATPPLSLTNRSYPYVR